LRSKLVFHPEGLRDTRFGEILYKADVLLKELSSGIPVLVPYRSSVRGFSSEFTIIRPAKTFQTTTQI
jgi:hypothetical protein